jgi:hypothetical protein
MIRTDRDPRFLIRFTSYDCSFYAKAIEWDGKVVQALFFPKNRAAAAERAGKVGWLDVTEEWDRRIANPPPVQIDPVAHIRSLAADGKEEELRAYLRSIPYNELRDLAGEWDVNGKGSRTSIVDGIVSKVVAPAAQA